MQRCFGKTQPRFADCNQIKVSLIKSAKKGSLNEMSRGQLCAAVCPVTQQQPAPHQAADHVGARRFAEISFIVSSVNHAAADD